MGDTKGFLKYGRAYPGYRPAWERLSDYDEVMLYLTNPCARDTDGKRHSYMNACAAENETAQVIHKGRCVFPARS